MQYNYFQTSSLHLQAMKIRYKYSLQVIILTAMQCMDYADQRTQYNFRGSFWSQICMMC